MFDIKCFNSNKRRSGDFRTRNMVEINFQLATKLYKLNLFNRLCMYTVCVCWECITEKFALCTNKRFTKKIFREYNTISKSSLFVFTKAKQSTRKNINEIIEFSRNYDAIASEANKRLGGQLKKAVNPELCPLHQE